MCLPQAVTLTLHNTVAGCLPSELGHAGNDSGLAKRRTFATLAQWPETLVRTRGKPLQASHRVIIGAISAATQRLNCPDRTSEHRAGARDTTRYVQ